MSQLRKETCASNSCLSTRSPETSDGTAHESGSGTIPRDPEELLMEGERAEDFSSTGSWHDTKPQTWKVPEKPIFSVSGDSSAGPHPCEHHNPGFNRRTERCCGGRATARPPPKGSRRLAKIFVLQLVGLVLTYNFTDCDFKKIKESYRNIIYQELNNYTKGTRAIDFDHFVYCEDQETGKSTDDHNDIHHSSRYSHLTDARKGLVGKTPNGAKPEDFNAYPSCPTVCAHVCVSEALPCSLGQDKAGLRLAAREESPPQQDRRPRQAALTLVRRRLNGPLPSVSLRSVAARVSAAKITPLPGCLPSRSLGSNMRILTQHRIFPAYALHALDGL
ncbi:hypothetical protein MJT46_007458 [Ovis ammon polii x Ovis aries]|nr:hypothetical protein MJT46_007458 [Ovis ammon polii x Ovis aries]